MRIIDETKVKNVLDGEFVPFGSLVMGEVFRSVGSFYFKTNSYAPSNELNAIEIGTGIAEHFSDNCPVWPVNEITFK